VVRLDAANRQVVVGARAALRMMRMRLRDVNWLGDGGIDAALAAGRLDVFVKVRSTRPPQPGWLVDVGGHYEVELIDGEEGVAPGQACVFYDAAKGQARVLGGGFIQSAAAAHAGMPAPAARVDVRAAVRG
jgi:tRNA-specific 2-thiouridylase